MSFRRTVGIRSAEILVCQQSTGPHTAMIVAHLMIGTVAMTGTFNWSTAEAFVVWIAKMSTRANNNERTVWSTIDTIAGIFANKIHTLTIKRTVGIFKTIDLLAAILMIVGVAGVETLLRTGTECLVIHHRTLGIGTARLIGTEIDAARHTAWIGTAGCCIGTVNVAARTFAGILTAPNPAIANFALRTATTKTARCVDAHSSRMAGRTDTFVNVQTAKTGHKIKARYAGTACAGTDLIPATVNIGPAASNASATDAHFAGRTIAVSGAVLKAQTVNATFTIDTVLTVGTTFAFKTTKTGRTGQRRQ